MSEEAFPSEEDIRRDLTEGCRLESLRYCFETWNEARQLHIALMVSISHPMKGKMPEMAGLRERAGREALLQAEAMLQRALARLSIRELIDITKNGLK